jgi:hypothetical protein
VILAGNGHCIDLGIPSRMQRRGVPRVASVAIMNEATYGQDAPGATLVNVDYTMIVSQR